MLRGVLAWWTEQMRDLVPKGLRRSARLRRHLRVTLADSPGPAAIELVLCNGGGSVPLGCFGLDEPELLDALTTVANTRRLPVILQVPPRLTLENSVTLPVAAAAHMQRTLGYEMDRLTPFRADEVFWTCAGGPPDAARGQVPVRLTIIPRAQVQPVLDVLQRSGITPAWIEAGEGTMPRRVIPLGPLRPGRSWLGARADATAVGCCAVLALAAAALPFVMQSLAGADVEARIDAARPMAAEAEALRRRITSSVNSADALSAARREVGAPLEAVALLTELLPDDTVLTLLTARQRKLTISGRSPAAARLIGTMAAHPSIHDPAFTAPVLHDDNSGRDMFSIQMEVGP